MPLEVIIPAPLWQPPSRSHRNLFAEPNISVGVPYTCGGQLGLAHGVIISGPSVFSSGSSGYHRWL